MMVTLVKSVLKVVKPVSDLLNKNVTVVTKMIPSLMPMVLLKILPGSLLKK